MVIESESADVRLARRTALELLLAEHAGECFAPCSQVCPAHLDIPEMIRQIRENDSRCRHPDRARRPRAPGHPRLRLPRPLRKRLPARDGRRAPSPSAPCIASPAKADLRNAHHLATRRSRPPPASASPSSAPARPAWPPPRNCSSSAIPAPSSIPTPCPAEPSAMASGRQAPRHDPRWRGAPAHRHRHHLAHGHHRRISVADLRNEFDAVAITAPARPAAQIRRPVPLRLGRRLPPPRRASHRRWQGPRPPGQ